MRPDPETHLCECGNRPYYVYSDGSTHPAWLECNHCHGAIPCPLWEDQAQV